MWHLYQIGDVVVVSRLLNATLVVPEIQSTTRSKGIRSGAFISKNMYLGYYQLIHSNNCVQSMGDSVSCSSKFKSFSYLYNEEQFISALAKDVKVIKTLPKNLKGARREKKIPHFMAPYHASPYFYLHHVLPVLNKHSVVELVISNGGCLQVWYNLVPAPSILLNWISRNLLFLFHSEVMRSFWYRIGYSPTPIWGVPKAEM